jgi:predicted transcriptional regulator YdeE
MKYIVADYDERYFAGLELPGGINVEDTENEEVPNLWGKLVNETISNIPNVVFPNKFIGLESFGPKFLMTKRFDYYALVQTEMLIENSENYVIKKLPKGRYICFEVSFNRLDEEIGKCHKYIETNNVNVNKDFDYTEYLENQDYSDENAKAQFCFLLVEE